MPDPITIVKVAKGALSVAKDAISLAKGVKFIHEQYHSYLERKEKDWWESVVHKFQGRTNTETEEEVEQKLHSLAVRDPALKVMSQAMKALLESVDDSVLPLLATLTAEYLATGQNPDGYFRGTCRMLSDVSYRELMSFREFIKNITHELENEPSVEKVTAIRVGGWNKDREPELHLAFMPGNHRAMMIPSCDHYELIASLLTRYGLARTPNVTGGSVPIEMNTTTVVKLASLLDEV